MKISLEIFGGALVRLGNAVHGFIVELKSVATDARVQAIAAEFPGGTAVDVACIALCNDALAAIDSLPQEINNRQNAVEAIYTKLAADIAKVKHNNTKHGFGFYLQLIGAVAEDLVAIVEGK